MNSPLEHSAPHRRATEHRRLCMSTGGYRTAGALARCQTQTPCAGAATLRGTGFRCLLWDLAMNDNCGCRFRADNNSLAYRVNEHTRQALEHSTNGTLHKVPSARCFLGNRSRRCCSCDMEHALLLVPGWERTIRCRRCRAQINLGCQARCLV